MDQILLVVHLAATACMTGLIWFVQGVHYPLYALVGEQEYPAYHREHVARTTLVVAPLMLTEAATASALALAGPGAIRTLAVWNLGLLVLIWVSTAVLQVPCHRRLEQGKDLATIHRLVQTNWIRTALWSARLVIAAGMVLA